MPTDVPFNENTSHSSLLALLRVTKETINTMETVKYPYFHLERSQTSPDACMGTQFFIIHYIASYLYHADPYVHLLIVVVSKCMAQLAIANLV